MSLRILFQGDSITDCGRDRSETAPNKNLGTGYVSLIAARLLCDDPDMKIYAGHGEDSTLQKALENAKFYLDF